MPPGLKCKTAVPGGAVAFRRWNAYPSPTRKPQRLVKTVGGSKMQSSGAWKYRAHVKVYVIDRTG